MQRIPSQLEPCLFIVLLAIFASPGSSHEQAIEAPVDVVRRHIDAVIARDTRIATQTLQDRVALFEAPTNPDQLTGSRSADQNTGEAALSVLLRRSLAEEVGGFVSVADLVAASTRTKQTTAAPGRTSLRLYRVREGRISAIWNLVEASADPTIGRNEARIRDFVKASNAGDIPAFLAHFSSDAKLWRAAADDNLVGPLSERMSTAQGRAEIIVNAFAKGPPGQAEIVDLVAVGDLVVTHDRVTLPTRVVLHQMKIYRLRDGLITHDWTAYERPE